MASMEFRPRNYRAEEKACALPRSRALTHPLSSQSSHHHKVDVVDDEKIDFYDPLRGQSADAVSAEDFQNNDSTRGQSKEAAVQIQAKEWTSFKRLLMQRFSASKMVSVSTTSDVIVKSDKACQKSSTSKHLEELDDPQKFAEEGVKVITQQEYVSRLYELKDEINRAWHAEDRVTSLKLSIKVARLLMDTSVLQFYPMLFVLATDIMDMLGDMVWERIKRKAEFSEDGSAICSLSDNFEASEICVDAKETCNNWFCKIGSIRELLPRIYLELAILPCWRFLHDQPMDNLQRLIMMTRGVADPLAFSYCHLYMVHCAQKLSMCDIGYLISCSNDIKILLTRMISEKETTHGNSSEKKRLLISLMEPTIEYIMKCMFKGAYQRQVGDIVVKLGLGRSESELFGDFPFISIVLHHLLKELPTEVVSSNAVGILHLINSCNDYSFDQCLNYRLLGFRLGERGSQRDMVNAVISNVIQVVAQFNSLDTYLKVVDAYVDIILQNRMDNYLDAILEGVSKRACNKHIDENELGSLQSIFVKLLTHFKNLEDIFALRHFVEILDVMYGSSRNIVNMHILNIATRNGYIHDPATIQLLFEISLALHDGIDFFSVKDDDNQQPAHLISHFVQMVDYGVEMERHLTFLVECRGAFGSIEELKQTLVHSSNCLAIKAMKEAKRHLSFVKSCIAFSEVTIPSISACNKQLNLYLETAEVALLCGLVSHSDGLLDSAVGCLQTLDLVDGFQIPNDVDSILSLIRKLCSLLVMVPGNPERGVTHIPKSILSLVSSQSWITPRIRTRILCAIISLSAALSQNKLPYHADNVEIPSNDLLYFGDSNYLRDLVLLSEFVLKNLTDVIQQEPSQAARGSMALEACNCIASSFKISPEIWTICSKMMETARSCSTSNNKYLQSTMKILGEYMPTSAAATPSTIIT